MANIILRDYQQQAVDATLQHFRHSTASAVLVLPTGAGKSLVIAELARIAKGRVLVLTHVKELVAQNAEKVGLMTDAAGIYSAGLGQKSTDDKTLVASIQSAARAREKFTTPFSLVIIDECHRVSLEKDSQYQQLLQHLKQINTNIRILGLTATPYRLGLGWIYRYHYHGKVGTPDKAVFEKCIFELPLRPLIKQGYLTPPTLYDGLEAQYDFSLLQAGEHGQYSEQQIDSLLSHSGRATKAIVGQIRLLAQQRRGVIIFAATVRHAEEIMTLLHGESSALITAQTDNDERDRLINAFKAQEIKFLVNVAVLTTGFDAPHVDFIAILRPTESVSLFQQMVGRGLRLAPNKHDCLVIDYAANGFDLYFPEVGQAKPDSKSVPVQVPCPACQFANIFWGLVDDDGDIIEHFGRRCQGLDEHNQQCSYRFRCRICPDCGAENDIAARVCNSCQSTLVDPDTHLKQVLGKQHHHLFRCQDMLLTAEAQTLVITYLDIEGNDYIRKFKMETPAQIRALYALFLHSHNKTPGIKLPKLQQPTDVIAIADHFRHPDLILLKKGKKGWDWLQAFFDYQGRYQIDKRQYATS
ncbi:helicase [Shewanella sp. NFH-SH190041]|uniref:DEAD/DEAH box helicase n=1 Tax=Shewanella sp. NFH-SH190041 TaxID=2950245 RepID=UPI0021C3839A|nr:DEAD/DEAH box helicase [Shewanella sp. NFH-SH190041]BDM64952.1 helicase [Shewanella sp. NFH-SH190041]